MKKSIEAKTLKRIYVAFLLSLLVLLASSIQGCSFGEQPAKDYSSPSATSTTSIEYAALANNIKHAIKELEYTEDVAQDLMKMVSRWKCDVWKQRLDQAKQDFQKKKINTTQIAQIEEKVIKEIYQGILKEISYAYDYKYYDLVKVVKDKKADCLGYSQLFYIIGNSTGLKVQTVFVLESPSFSADFTHSACLLALSDKSVMIVDLSHQFVSKSFIFKEEYIEDGNYWLLREKTNRLGNYRRIQIWDVNGLIAAINYCRGFESDESGKKMEAISYHTHAIKLNPKYVDIYVNRGLVYANLGKYKEAISDYDKAIALDAKNAEVYFIRGLEYFNLGKYTEAISDFSKTIELDPKNTDAYISLGNGYSGLGKYADAILYYSKAIDLDPKNAKAYYARGSDNSRLGQYKEAVSDLTKAIQLDPKDAKAYCNRGITFYKLGQFTEAISDYNKTIQLDPKNANAYYNRGLVHSRLSQETVAISDFTKSIEFDPKNTDAYYSRGLAEANLGKTEEAKEDLQKVLELAPALKEQVKAISDKFNLGM